MPVAEGVTFAATFHVRKLSLVQKAGFSKAAKPLLIPWVIVSPCCHRAHSPPRWAWHLCFWGNDSIYISVFMPVRHRIKKWLEQNPLWLKNRAVWYQPPNSLHIFAFLLPFRVWEIGEFSLCRTKFLTGRGKSVLSVFFKFTVLNYIYSRMSKMIKLMLKWVP